MDNLFADDLFVDPEKNWLDELVGEGKKYKDTSALAYSRAEADAYAARLERENAQLREDNTKRIGFEELLNKLNSLPASNQRPQDEDEDLGTTSAMKPQDLERLVEDKIRNLEDSRSAAQNIRTVKAKLEETYGPNYAQQLRKQASELGVTEDFIQNLASKHPQAVFKLLGVDKPKDTKDNLFSSPPKTHISSLPQGSKKTYSQYKETYKKNFYDPKVQNEIFSLMRDMSPEQREEFLNS